MASIEELKEELKTILDDHRYIHSIGVMESCEKLAKNYNLSEEDTERRPICQYIVRQRVGGLRPLPRRQEVERQLHPGRNLRRLEQI